MTACSASQPVPDIPSHRTLARQDLIMMSASSLRVYTQRESILHRSNVLTLPLHGMDPVLSRDGHERAGTGRHYGLAWTETRYVPHTTTSMTWRQRARYNLACSHLSRVIAGMRAYLNLSSHKTIHLRPGAADMQHTAERGEPVRRL